MRAAFSKTVNHETIQSDEYLDCGGKAEDDRLMEKGRDLVMMNAY